MQSQWTLLLRDRYNVILNGMAVLWLCLPVLQSFFGLPAQRPPTPSGGDTSQGQGSQMEGGSHKDSGKEATRLWALASGPTQKQVRVHVCLDCLWPLVHSNHQKSCQRCIVVKASATVWG